MVHEDETEEHMDYSLLVRSDVTYAEEALQAMILLQQGRQRIWQGTVLLVFVMELVSPTCDEACAVQASGLSNGLL